MNLLVKKWRNLLVISSVVFAFFSCSEQSEIGLELNPGAISADVKYTEIALSSTNIKYDSLLSSNASRMLVGRKVSPVFGDSRANAIVNFITSDTLIEKADDQVYSYLKCRVVLDVDVLNTTDIASEQEIFIHKLNEDLENVNSVYYLSDFQIGMNEAYTPSSKFSIDSIKYKDYLAYLETGESNGADSTYQIEFEASNLFGDEIWQIFLNNSESEVSGKINDAFKGIAFVSAESNTIMTEANVSAESKIEILYEVQDDEGKQVIQDTLTMTFSGNRYNQVSVEHGSSSFAGISNLDEQDIDSDIVYLSSADGIYPVIDLSNISSTLDELEAESGQFILINRAELYLEIDNNSQYVQEVSDIQFYYQGKDLKIKGSDIWQQIRSSPANYIESAVLDDASFLSGSGLPLTISNSDNSFTAPMSNFIQLLESGDLQERGLLENSKLVLMPSNRVTFDEGRFLKNSIKLKVWYTITR
ncbi:DUF4270 family protein [Reichenbachiella versicolor]|uniref:DUF4270 family protein n=1 Tax=Reichenbachiella versicolor TaxID=1821036 RepID=UPI000D6EB01E|nr:DUF4270 family protein [Reichenbachiella versicolor]